MAYVSTESRGRQVYVVSFPGKENKLQISTDGGMSPVWRRDGRELFYVVSTESGGDLAGRLPTTAMTERVVSVPVSLQPVFHVGSPSTLFHGRYLVNWPARSYDVSADGKRFLMVTRQEQPQPRTAHMSLILNWFEELKQRVPSSR